MCSRAHVEFVVIVINLMFEQFVFYLGFRTATSHKKVENMTDEIQREILSVLQN